MRECLRYFPLHRENARTVVERHYRYAQKWWKAEREVEPEQPNARFGLHIAILRHKLRLIWEVAGSGNLVRAKRKVEQASVEMLQLARDIHFGTTNDPYVRLSSLLGWLRDNVGSSEDLRESGMCDGENLLLPGLPARQILRFSLRQTREGASARTTRERKTT
jgi:hypothetical protein